MTEIEGVSYGRNMRNVLKICCMRFAKIFLTRTYLRPEVYQQMFDFHFTEQVYTSAQLEVVLVSRFRLLSYV